MFAKLLPLAPRRDPTVDFMLQGAQVASGTSIGYTVSATHSPLQTRPRSALRAHQVQFARLAAGLSVTEILGIVPSPSDSNPCVLCNERIHGSIMGTANQITRAISGKRLSGGEADGSQETPSPESRLPKYLAKPKILDGGWPITAASIAVGVTPWIFPFPQDWSVAMRVAAAALFIFCFWLVIFLVRWIRCLVRRMTAYDQLFEFSIEQNNCAQTAYESFLKIDQHLTEMTNKLRLEEERTFVFERVLQVHGAYISLVDIQSFTTDTSNREPYVLLRYKEGLERGSRVVIVEGSSGRAFGTFVVVTERREPTRANKELIWNEHWWDHVIGSSRSGYYEPRSEVAILV